MRLSEIVRELLQVECRRCGRTIEIERLDDAIKLDRRHATWREAS